MAKQPNSPQDNPEVAPEVAPVVEAPSTSNAIPVSSSTARDDGSVYVRTEFADGTIREDM